MSEKKEGSDHHRKRKGHESASRGGLLSRIPPEPPVFLFYLLTAVFLTWPLIIRFTRSTYGVAGDNLGTIWQWWWLKSAHSFGAKASFCPVVGYPFGTPVVTFTLEPVADLTDRFMLLFLNEVAAYNLAIFASFILSGVTMYYLVRYLTRNRYAAFFGGFAYLVCCFHAAHATIFVRLAATQWMPLFILVLLVFMKKPDLKNAALLILTGAVVAGTCIHYGLFMAIFTLSFLLGRFAYKRLSARREMKSLERESGPGPTGSGARRPPLRINKKTLALAALVIIVLIVLFAPFLYLSLRGQYWSPSWSITPAPGSGRTLLLSKWGSAEPWDYILPNLNNPLLGDVTGRVIGNRTNFYRNSLYLGWTVIILAFLAIAFVRRRRPGREPPAGSRKGQTGQGQPPIEERAGHGLSIDKIERRAVIWGFALAGVVGFILSLRPYVNVGSARIPLPSIVFRAFVPWFRWYLRTGIITVICSIVLACYGLCWLLGRLRGVAREILLVALLAVLFVEMIIVPPFMNLDLGRTPDLYRRVADLPGESGLMFYPAYDPGFFYTSRLLFYQRESAKPMLNGAADLTDGEALRRTVYNPFDPATPSILRRFDLEYVVYLGKLFEKYEGYEKPQTAVTRLPPGFELVARVKDDDPLGDAYIFRVTAPPAGLVPIYSRGISVPHMEVGRETVRKVKGEGIINILNFTGGRARARLQIPVGNTADRQQVVVKQGGAVLRSVYLENGEERVLEISGVEVPAGGTSLRLIPGGRAVSVTDREVQLFGFEEANIRLGDVALSLEPEGQRHP